MAPQPAKPIQIHFNDTKNSLANGEYLSVPVLDLCAHKAQMAGLVSGFGSAKELFPFCREYILDIHVDGRTVVSGIQERKNGPCHCGIHQGKQNAAMGPLGKRPAETGRRF